MYEREKLLSFLRIKKQLNTSISSIKDEYLDALQGRPPIYISDHSMARYLERVKKETLIGISDWDKVYEYLKRKGMYSRDLREEIFSKGEMRHIVANEIERYEKNGYVYIVKGLTLITVYIKETKDDKRNDNNDSTTGADSSNSSGTTCSNIQEQTEPVELGSSSEAINREFKKSTQLRTKNKE